MIIGDKAVIAVERISSAADDAFGYLADTDHFDTTPPPICFEHIRILSTGTEWATAATV